MLKENEGQEQNCVGLTVQREARCTNDLLGFSDKELLALVAKSIDCEVSFTGNGTPYFKNGGDAFLYDPLSTDSQALKLAVMLGLEIKFTRNDSIDIYENLTEHRKLIVLAAAQIGRART